MAALNDEDVTDVEHDNFLGDAFVLTYENGVNDDNVCEIMNMGCNRPHKNE